ncbi:MAG: ABC transporter substrate-binding protein [Dehalococcoidia bacterium]|nr:ABC transporter substrate-binding protein [Dehalococcoidia bacterium]
MPVPTGSLRLALDSVDGSMNPDFTSRRQYLEVMFDYAINNNTKGELDPSRSFITSWTSNADATQWTFKVRDSIVFHNGDKATSKDLKGSIDYSVRTGSKLSQANAVKSAIAGIDLPDPGTAIVRLNSVKIFLPVEFFSSLDSTTVEFVIPSDYMAAQKDTGFEKAPVGSGPYKWKANTPGDSVSFEAQARHWYYGVPRWANIEFRAVPDSNARLAVIRTGQADVTKISTSQVTASKAAGLTVHNKDGAAIAMMYFHQQWHDGTPMANERVREALNLALDRKSIVDKFMAGLATPSVNYPVTVKDLAFEKPAPVPGYDPAKARQLLEAAGQKNLAFNLYMYSNGIEEAAEIMEAVADYWEKVGLKVTRLPMAHPAFQDRWFNEKLDDPAVSGLLTVGTRPIGNTIARGLGGADLTLRTTSGQSRDPVFVQPIKDMLTAATLDVYKKNIRTVQQLVSSKFLYAPLFEYGTLFASRPQVVPPAWYPGFSPYGYNVLGMIDPKP